MLAGPGGINLTNIKAINYPTLLFYLQGIFFQFILLHKTLFIEKLFTF